MARIADRNKALELRKSGHSYSQIKEKINVSKSTLSYWLNDYPLPPERIRELRDWNQRRIERYRETVRRKREVRLSQVYKEQNSAILPLSNRDLFIAGLFLYWGEGGKTRFDALVISNTDPAVPKFFIKWVEKFFNIQKNKIKVRLQLYSDMDIEKETQFWSKSLQISKKQFNKPYIKQSKIINLTRKGGFGHGTCNIKASGARLAEQVLIGLKVIRDQLQ